ncbi:MAG: hypothetical protein A3J82_07255 [Elusimicrobia bacterium RIFOXYA2_FULL_69_6]|nr:MAG: hypothetical protein A3J82_07255 [Elusimicrobia bacterium RIFOXYA2_FULL_69_6]
MVGTGIFAGYYKLQLIGWSEAERYFAVPLLPVKLEDLHADPRGQMEKVAAWLGLRWDDRLLKSTFNGLEFWGDAQAVKPVQGFSTSHTHYQGWQEQFDALDQFVVAGLLGKNFERFGYWELPFWHRPLCLLLILWPAKLERRALALAAGALLRLDHPGQALRSLLRIMRRIAERYDLSYRQFLKSIGWVEKFYLRFVAPRRKLYFRYRPPR